MGNQLSEGNEQLSTLAGLKKVKVMQIYVDGMKRYQIAASRLDVSLSMAIGQRRLTVQAVDSGRLVFKKTIFITVK